MNSTPLCAVCTKGELLFIDIKTCGNMLLDCGENRKKNPTFIAGSRLFLMTCFDLVPFLAAAFCIAHYLPRLRLAAFPRNQFFHLKKHCWAQCVCTLHIFFLFTSRGFFWIGGKLWNMIRFWHHLPICASLREKKRKCAAHNYFELVFTRTLEIPNKRVATVWETLLLSAQSAMLSFHLQTKYLDFSKG